MLSFILSSVVMVIRGNGYSAPSNLSSWVVVDGNIVLSEASHSIDAVKAVYTLTASTVEKSKGTDANRYSILSKTESDSDISSSSSSDENIKLIHNMTNKLSSSVNRHLVASSSKSNRVIKSSNGRLPLFHNSKDFTEVLTAKSPACFKYWPISCCTVCFTFFENSFIISC